MNFDPKKHKSELLFLPLGGSGEIGMNLNLYHYQGKWLMVDLGIGFASENLPGVDITVPDISFIEKNAHNLLGLVITHAHEDHVGAVQYLWQDLKCPIYTTKFTAAILKAKFSEAGVGKSTPVHEMEFNSRFNVGPFDLELCGMTHSVPEMQALVIRTEHGNILHTGDWKLDENPLVGTSTNEDALRKLGDEGILALVGDSTNIFSEGTSGSEGELSKSLSDLIYGFKNNMVVVTTFASNIARVYSLARAGQTMGRKVVLVGRSLWRMYEAAKQCGYLTDLLPLLTDDQISKHKREDLLVICTGSQGESLAAMSRVAYDAHPRFKVAKGDAVIFASKIIPGNEKKIYALMNELCKKGVEVLTERDHFVHVSGHPSRDEVAKLYELVRPKMAIPVHGEAMHLHEHAKFAIAHGAKHAIEVINGDVIRLNQDGMEKIGSVKAGYMAIDGNFIISPDANVLKLRRRMREAGLVIATVVLAKGALAKQPKIIAPGLFDDDEDREFILEISNEVADFVQANKKKGDAVLEKGAREIIRRMVKKESAKDPFIIFQLEKLA